MAKVDDDIRDTLKADGRWREFMASRKRLIESGISPNDALVLSVKEVCPEFYGRYRDKMGRRPGRPSKVLEEVVASIGSGEGAGAGEDSAEKTGKAGKTKGGVKLTGDPKIDRLLQRREDANNRAIERIVRAGKVAEAVEARAEAARAAKEAKEEARRKKSLVAKGAFSGKEKVGASDEILWVAENLNMDVTADDAPGALAWNFLTMCRQSDDFKVKFMLNIAADVVKRRSDEEAKGDEKFDGEAEFDLLGGFAAKLAEVTGGEA